MKKIGRNETCPCGSDKKHKNCCWGESEDVIFLKQMNTHLAQMWTYDKVKKMSDAEIISKLAEMNIPFNEERFLVDIDVYSSANGLAEAWFETHDVIAEGYDEGFLFLAVWILWERLVSQGNWPIETVCGWFDMGVRAEAEGKKTEACDFWLKAWDALKRHNPPASKNLDYLDELCSGEFSIREILSELGFELQNAGVKDPSYYSKEITYCNEFLDLFPDEEEHTQIDLRRNSADAYLELGDSLRAEATFKRITLDYPTNVWGYISWGDMYHFHQPNNFEKAKEIYENGLAKTAANATERDVLEERLEMLEKYSETQ